jgi:hypothetical protein
MFEERTRNRDRDREQSFEDDQDRKSRFRNYINQQGGCFTIHLLSLYPKWTLFKVQKVAGAFTSFAKRMIFAL